MAAARTIFVVAAHEGLRRSIAFALEAEGYAVISRRRLSDLASSTAAGDVGCVVVDEETVEADDGDWERLGLFGPALVLLTNGMRFVPAGLTTRTLTKPLLGGSLTERVAAVLVERGAAAGHGAT